MPQDSQAVEFYDRIVEGREYTSTITLEHSSGQTLEGVRMSPVDKRILADVMNSLPEEMFGAVEDADSPEEAEEMLENSDSGASLSSMSSDTVDAFEKLVKESISHPELTDAQMRSIIEALDFGILFELGGEIIDMSFSDGEAIRDFRAQE